MTQLVTQDGVTLDQQGATLFLQGGLTMNAAAQVAAAGTLWLEQSASTPVTLDFTGVETASSVALSVLFEWLRTCGQRAITVERIALSPPLMRLASLAELDDMIDAPHLALTS
ncbi:STAS domain-containing protein [Vreelandella sp. GE22]